MIANKSVENKLLVIKCDKVEKNKYNSSAIFFKKKMTNHNYDKEPNTYLKTVDNKKIWDGEVCPQTKNPFIVCTIVNDLVMALSYLSNWLVYW